MKPVLAALLSFLLLLAVLMGLGTALFIGFGALLARWLPLSLFQASCLAIGATIAVAAILYVLSTIRHAHREYDLDDDFKRKRTMSAPTSQTATLPSPNLTSPWSQAMTTALAEAERNSRIAANIQPPSSRETRYSQVHA